MHRELDDKFLGNPLGRHEKKNSPESKKNYQSNGKKHLNNFESLYDLHLLENSLE